MRVTIERSALAKAIGHATGVVERRNTIPILANVLIEAEGDQAGIVATDLNLQIRLSVPARVEEAGSTTVDAYLLHSIVREFPDGSQVELAQGEGDGKLKIASGRARYQLQSLPARDFPSMQALDDGVAFAMQAKTLASLLARTDFAQNRNDPARPYLEGTRFQVIDGKLVAAATNGHCLAEATCDMPEADGELPAVTLPIRFCAELRKLLDETDAEARVAFGARRASVIVGSAELSGKLVEGSFPDWRRVIPTQNEKRLLVHRDSFAGAVRRSAVIAFDKVRVVKIDLAQDKLTCSATSHEYGSAAEETPAAYDAPELTLGFNGKYLLDTFAAIGSDEVQADLADPMAPALFTNPNDSSARWVVMPTRV
jgi:DNA polymerase-3 subunit beta